MWLIDFVLYCHQKFFKMLYLDVLFFNCVTVLGFFFTFLLVGVDIFCDHWKGHLSIHPKIIFILSKDNFGTYECFKNCFHALLCKKYDAPGKLFCALQEVSLHQELHPHESVLLLHPESKCCLHQRWRSFFR